ncbi:MAG: sugar phosphate isomerase/epimerase [Ruminococcaceae bacterium]|nr:sugar phosphate isomerase/epimerase [Oscillospiraceae bacterium]
MIDYGLQLYSVRDLAGENLKEALRRVAALGYRYVEFAGFFGNPAEEVKAWLDQYGLLVSGTHTGFDELTPERIEATIAYHQTIGCQNIIIPGGCWTTAEDMEQRIASLNWAQKRLAEVGITLGYHNHSKEFYTTPYGKVIEDEVLNRTNVLLEIDTFWIYNAGIDPVEYCEKHKDRIRMIHLKDGVIPTDTARDYATAHHGVKGVSLGSGAAPVARVREWAIENGILMVVESEGLDPTGIEEAERCIQYLRSLEQ